jgi:protease I
MNLEGTKIGILIEDQYEDIELWYPLLRLREAGAEVVVIGMEKGKRYTGKRGYPMTADASVTETSADDLSALIVPGGYAPDRMRVHEELIDLVRDVNAREKVVAMICHAGWVGISAGIVDGKRATSVRPIRDDMVNAGAEWVDEEVVVDGNLITSRTPWDLPAFCRAIIEELSRPE